jgi:RNase adapter protein RapZ
MKNLKIVIITGLSGSGKSIALAAFEDAGFYCVDNMPVELLPKFLELPLKTETEIKGLSFVMDLREKGFLAAYPGVFEELRQKGYRFDIIFLEADQAVLIKRYSQTRRTHPLAQDKPLIDSVREEKKLLEPLRIIASDIIDTSEYNVHDLKSAIFKIAQQSVSTNVMRIQIISFGFKYGPPREADMIMDVRFIKNPFFIPALQPLDGRNASVRDFVLSHPVSQKFLKRFFELIDFLIPLYEKEGKAYLTIAMGCTGGRHRSVVMADALYTHIRQPGRPTYLTHRDIGIES